LYNDFGAFLTINTKDSSFVTTGDITADYIYGDTLYITKIVGFDPVDTTRLFFLVKDNTFAYDIQIKNITSTRLATVDSLSVTNVIGNLNPTSDYGGNLGIKTSTSTGLRWDTVNARVFYGDNLLSRESITIGVDVVGKILYLIGGAATYNVASDGFYPTTHKGRDLGRYNKWYDSCFVDNYLGSNINITGLATIDSLSVTSLVSNFIPVTDKTLDVGSSTKYVRSIYVDTVYAGSKISIVNALDWIVGTNGTDRWKIDSDGHFYPLADSTYDFGIASTNRIRNLYASNIFTNGVIQSGDDFVMIWKGASSEAPASPITGWCYYDTDDEVAYVWTGANWQALYTP